MTLDINRFCALSRREDFQQWLQTNYPEGHTELIEHLQKGEGCGSNKNKMKVIHAKIQALGKENALIDFIRKSYPHMIVRNVTNSVPKPAAELISSLPFEEQNFHKVFPSYNPRLLVFPQRKIFVSSDYTAVNNAIVNFVKFQLGIDYVILKGPKFYHGYVEYFEKKYETVITRIPMNKRPITIYKAQHGIR